MINGEAEFDQNRAYSPKGNGLFAFYTLRLTIENNTMLYACPPKAWLFAVGGCFALCGMLVWA
jgi:hypothetical protein